MNEYYSKKRESILTLFKDGALLTAKGICNLMPAIDRATVYRTLNSLVEKGVLREVHLHKEYSHFELIHEGDTHQHFICTNCDTVLPIAVDVKDIRKLIPKNVESKDFELNVKGFCNNCK